MSGRTTWSGRTGPLLPSERLAIARLLHSYPAPIKAIRWHREAYAIDLVERLIGGDLLELRGFMRVRGRGHASRPLTLELTRRAFAALPELATPRGRATFIGETESSWLPAAECLQ